MNLNISKILKKLLQLIENHLNLVILIIFVIVILYASWLFYNFVYKPISATPEVFFERVEVKKTVFENVTERLELREENISKAMGKEYPDIFK